MNNYPMSAIYLIKYGTNVFEKETLVKFITCSDSGKCYLMADLNDDLKREWVMYYELYPVDWKSKDHSYRYYYDENFQKKADELLLNHLSS